MLSNLASPNYSPDSSGAYKNYLRAEHGLDNQDMPAIDAATSVLQSFLQQIGETLAQMEGGKTPLSPADIATLQSLFADRETLIANLANQVLGAVRPQVAASLRTAGHIVAAATQNAPVASSIASATVATSLAALQDCIGGGAAGDCQLSPGIYTVPFTDSSGRQATTLQIGRSGFTISGMGDASETVIQRGAPNVVSLMTADGRVTDVAIRNLTFDGNRYGFGGALSCLPANAPIYDLNLSYGGSFTVQFVDFINAPGYAVQVSGTSTVSYSHFGWGTANESAQQTATRSTAIWISGRNGGAYYNDIGFAGTAGINLSGKNLYAYGNFLRNNRYEMPDGQGGQLYIAPNSRDARVIGNVIDGNYWETAPNSSLATGCQPSQLSGIQAPYGVEAYGSGHGFYNNEIERQMGAGMTFGGGAPAGQITISGANPWNLEDVPRFIELNLGSGLWFLGTHFFDFAYPVRGARLDNILVRNNGGYGVLLDSVSDSNTYTGFVNGSCMSGNASGNVYAPNSDLTNPYPNSYTSFRLPEALSQVSSAKPCTDWNSHARPTHE